MTYMTFMQGVLYCVYYIKRYMKVSPIYNKTKNNLWFFHLPFPFPTPFDIGLFKGGGAIFEVIRVLFGRLRQAGAPG